MSSAGLNYAVIWRIGQFNSSVQCCGWMEVVRFGAEELSAEVRRRDHPEPSGGHAGHLEAAVGEEGALEVEPRPADLHDRVRRARGPDEPPAKPAYSL